MTASRSDRRRQLIPRWRPWRVTASLGEASRRSVALRPVDGNPLEGLLHEYDLKPDLGRASDLLAASVINATVPSKVSGVAHRLLGDDTTPALLRELAEHV